MEIQLIVVTYGDLINPVSPPLRKWWDEIESWAINLNVPPNEISAGFKEKPKGLISHNAYKLARYRSLFAKQLDKENVEYIELMRIWPKEGYKTSDWDFCGLYGADRPAGAIFTVGVDLERLHVLANASPKVFSHEAVRRSSQYLQAKYGFAVSMPKLFMPGGYAIGLAAEVPKEMVYDCNAWSRFSAKDSDRSLRNIYGYNILSAKHLEITVGDQRLEDWIMAAGGRGRIESMGKGQFIWTFQEGDDKKAFLAWDYPPVVRVREELKQYEIFPWQKLIRQQQIPLERDK